MKNPEDLGLNRTGIAMSPIDTAAMIEKTPTPPAPHGSRETLETYRGNYIKDAELIGTVPLPGTVKGVAKTVLGKLKGNRPEVFVDKLGERIAFERTGVRLYELLLNKCKIRPDEMPEAPLAMLELIRDDELRHFEMLTRVMRDIGGDPTAMTPGADVNGVMAGGLVQVLADPRTTIAQSLQAILLAELADNDAWILLAALADEQGMDSAAKEFRAAEIEERRHLQEIRGLVSQAVLNKPATVH